MRKQESSGKESHWEPKYPFDMVILYEDMTTRNRVLSLYDQLAVRLASGYDFRCTWWTFAHLQSLALRRRAIDAAVEAHMIILSLRAGTHLPEPIWGWLEGWLPAKRYDKNSSALVTLIAETTPQHQGPCPIQVCLEKLARSANMEFFGHSFESMDLKVFQGLKFPGKENSGSSPPSPPPAASAPEASTPSRRSPVDPRRPFLTHWGINE